MVTRTQAATDAGLSERQRKTALRVANISESEFNEQVESDTPPTITQLAEQGKQAKPIVDLQGIDPRDYARATELQGTLRRFLADLKERHTELLNPFAEVSPSATVLRPIS